MRSLLPRLAATLLLAVVAVGCSRGEPETTPPSPSATESTFEVHPVVGERVDAVFHVSSREILGHGTREPLDEDGAGQVRDAMATWLDGHLDDLQYGGPGDLASIAAAGLEIPEPTPEPTASGASADPQPSASASASEPAPPPPDPRITAVTTDLTNPDNPVASARYHLAVYGENVLEWASARVEVTQADGTVASATFAFTIGEEYALTLVMAGPEPEVAS